MMRNLALLLLVSMLAACGGSDSTGVDENEKPTISFSTNVLAVQKGMPVDLTVSIDDPDGDPLSVSWQVSANGGSLDSNDQGSPTMTWTPPPSVGSHTITATVSDGKQTASASIELQTGTVWSNDVLGGVTVWTNANSPYILKQTPGDLNFIISGGELEIGPGVTVLIDTEMQEINVVGTLDINGVAGQPVVIKPNRQAPAPGFWKGILADIEGNMTGEVLIDYTHISHAENNIRADEDANVTILNSILTFSSGACIYFRSSGDLIIDHCDISQNNGHGIHAEKISYSPLDSVLQILVTNTNIQFNQGSGVQIDHNENYAIHSTVEFTADSIAFNDFNGIDLLRGAYPVVSECAVFFNDIFRVNNGFNVRVDPGFVGLYDFIDARNNYWGGSFAAADSAEIDLLIYDKKDYSALPKVQFYPWCNDHPCP